jgi:hypothetical protein
LPKEHVEEIVGAVFTLVELDSWRQKRDEGISVQEYFVNSKIVGLDRWLQSIVIGTNNMDAWMSRNTHPELFLKVPSLIKLWSWTIIVDSFAPTAEPRLPEDPWNALKAIRTDDSPPQICGCSVSKLS